MACRSADEEPPLHTRIIQAGLPSIVLLILLSLQSWLREAVVSL